MELKGRRVGLLIEDEYQEMEGWYPKLRLQEADATVVVIGSGTKSVYESKLGYPMEADQSASETNADDLDALIIPGGYAPDHMRLHDSMIDLVRKVHEADKLVASICHGGWMLVSANIVDGRQVTGYRPIRDDVVNAGGEWVDAPVVRDGNIITSRTPDDLPHFLQAIVSALS